MSFERAPAKQNEKKKGKNVLKRGIWVLGNEEFCEFCYLKNGSKCWLILKGGRNEEKIEIEGNLDVAGAAPLPAFSGSVLGWWVFLDFRPTF